VRSHIPVHTRKRRKKARIQDIKQEKERKRRLVSISSMSLGGQAVGLVRSPIRSQFTKLPFKCQSTEQQINTPTRTDRGISRKEGLLVFDRRNFGRIIGVQKTDIHQREIARKSSVAFALSPLLTVDGSERVCVPSTKKKKRYLHVFHKEVIFEYVICLVYHLVSAENKIRNVKID
jgi:hypothetical protein